MSRKRQLSNAIAASLQDLARIERKPPLLPLWNPSPRTIAACSALIYAAAGRSPHKAKA